MTTPNGSVIILHGQDGSEQYVTEAVQTLYDLLIDSLDWGSGFLSVEDVVPIARMAAAAGFEGAIESAERYIKAGRKRSRRSIAAASCAVRFRNPCKWARSVRPV